MLTVNYGHCDCCGKRAEDSGGDWQPLVLTPKGKMCWSCISSHKALKKMGFKVETLLYMQRYDG